jgi:hypothetical protein
MVRKRIAFTWAAAAWGLLGLVSAAAAGDCCPSGACGPVCQPVPDTKTITKRVYRDTCDDLCLIHSRPFGWLFSHGGHGCADCPSCEGKKCKRCPHKDLWVKECKHEAGICKCVPVVAAPCPAPCPAPGAPALAPPGAPAQVLPAAPPVLALPLRALPPAP